MTGQEIRARLRAVPFEPFRLTMDNGQAFVVRHPELALLSATGALYIYQPVDDEIAQVAGPAVACELRSISTIETVS
jgi:hypothetical protein